MRPRLTARRAAVGAAILAVGLVGLTAIGTRSDAPAAEPEPADQPNTAEVTRSDLVDTLTFDATIGREVDDPLAAATGGVLTAVAPVDTILDDGDEAWAIDGVGTPVVIDDAVLYRDLELGDSAVAVSATSVGTVAHAAMIGDEIEQGDPLYWIGGEPVVVLYGDVPMSRALYWPEPDEDTSTTYAADVRDAQSRVDLVDGIADAQAALDEARADTPSNTLLNAIDDLTQLEYSLTADSTEVNRAQQRVAEAQAADEDRIVRAEEALVEAEQRLLDFDEVQAAAARDQAAADASRPVQDNLVGADVEQLEAALVALGYGDDLTVDTEFTEATHRAVVDWQTDLGVAADGVVEVDDVVFVPGPAIVIEIVDDRTDVSPGSPVARLSGGSPLVGDDVRLLEDAIVRSLSPDDLPDGFVADDTFTAATQQAVLVWQERTGQEVDGIVSPTDVLVLRSPTVVTDHLNEPGTRLRDGDLVLAIASPDRIVTVDVPAEDQTVVSVGDAAVVTLPDFSETTGVVTALASVATTTPDGSTFFEATIELDDPSVADSLDEAPVEATVIESRIDGAVTVPVTALIALAEGGYAVEVVTASGPQLVAVDPGAFADGRVELRSTTVEPGDLVTVP